MNMVKKAINWVFGSGDEAKRIERHEAFKRCLQDGDITSTTLRRKQQELEEAISLRQAAAETLKQHQRG